MNATPREKLIWCGLPGLGALILFLLFSFGAIRSPDSEVVFRTAENLANHGRFGLDHDLENYARFGLPVGKDGKHYSLFGPGESVALVPFVWMGQWLNTTEWYASYQESLPRSLFLIRYQMVSDTSSGDVEVHMRKEDVFPLKDHALRTISMSYNAVVGAACVSLFMWLTWLVCGDKRAALLTAITFGAASPLLPYTGTLFSEPLATFFMLCSLLQSVHLERTVHTLDRAAYLRLALGGLFLGFSVCTHITSLLFIPFFGLHAMWRFAKPPLHAIKAGFIYGLPLLAMLILLGYFNASRFGAFWETGRTADPEVYYATWVLPFKGLWGFTFGWGKGMFVFAPATLLGLCLWFKFHRSCKRLSILILAAMIFRAIIVGSRSDWHGGLCLGSRLMTLVVPLTLIPIACALADWLKQGKVDRLWAMATGLMLFISHQVYLALGDAFMHYIKIDAIGTHFKYDIKDEIFVLAAYSPLFSSLKERGPWLLGALPISTVGLWLSLSALGCILIAVLMRRFTKTNP